MMNTMRYDAAVAGNHDIEVGNDVLKRFANDCEHPVLCANSKAFPPYTILERQGIRIAVIGITTTAVSHWLHPSLWKSMQLTDAFESAKLWLEEMKRTECTDLTVGLFHTGWNGGIEDENVTERVARETEGFDLILYGHDHHPAIHEEHGVLCVNPGSHALSVAEVDIEIDRGRDGIVKKEITARIVRVGPSPHTASAPHEKAIENWLSTPLAKLTKALDEREAYFGTSLFIDFFHTIQMSVMKADVSLFSPVSFDTTIDAGILTMLDAFRLYRYETPLYKMLLTGREIKSVLEMSYAMWANRMTCPDDDALLLEYNMDDGCRKGLKNISLNMVSACGIAYTVDLSREAGERVEILHFDDGREFSPDATYSIVVNSYHGNGGGCLLTKGAGIPSSELPARIIGISPKGLRDYLIEYLKREKSVTPSIVSNWRFIPEEWTFAALKRDRDIIFPR